MVISIYCVKLCKKANVEKDKLDTLPNCIADRINSLPIYKKDNILLNVYKYVTVYSVRRAAGVIVIIFCAIQVKATKRCHQIFVAFLEILNFIHLFPTKEIPIRISQLKIPTQPVALKLAITSYNGSHTYLAPRLYV